MRSDATRNATAILDAARAVVAERGIAAPMAEIARRAGLAVGTLYRHYPTKQHLVAAVVADSAARTAELAESASARVESGEETATEAFGGTVREIAAIYATDRAFKERLGTYDPTDPLRDIAAESVEARAVAAVAALLTLAQDAGAVRRDVTVGDLASLLAGLPGASGRPREIYLEVILAGLAPVPHR
ncbi:MAG: helix-turn-helix domain-containing protein [Dermatophilaceae bacterium]